MQVSFVPSGAKWRTLFTWRGLGLNAIACCLFMLAACSNPTGWMQGLGGGDDSDSPLPPPLIADEEGVVPDPRERRKAAEVPTGLRAATPPAQGNQEAAEAGAPQYTDDSLRGGQIAAAAPPRVMPPAPTSRAPSVPEVSPKVNKVPAIPQPPVAQAPIAPPAVAKNVPPAPPSVLTPATVPPTVPPALRTPPPPIVAAKPAPVPPAPAISAPARIAPAQIAPPATGTRSGIASVTPQPAPVPPGPAPSPPAVQKLPGYPPAPDYGANTPPAVTALPAQPMPLPPSAPIAQSGLAPQPPRPMQMPPPVTAMQVPPLGTPEAETLPPALTPAPFAQSTMTPSRQVQQAPAQWQQQPTQWQAPASAQSGWRMAEQQSLAQFADIPAGLVETIYFKSGSANLDHRDRQKIGAAAEKYKQRRGGIIRVVGHASSRTQNITEVQQMMTNWKISQRRAAAVADALIRAGVAPDSVVVEAVSDREPIYVESLPAGEAGNRRAEIYLE